MLVKVKFMIVIKSCCKTMPEIFARSSVAFFSLKSWIRIRANQNFWNEPRFEPAPYTEELQHYHYTMMVTFLANRYA